MQLVSPHWMFDDQIHHSALTFGKHVALELMLHLQFDLTQRGARCCTLQDRSHASVRAAPGPKRREEAMELDNTPDQTEVPLRNGERTPLPPTLAASFSLSPANGKVATNPVRSECEKKMEGMVRPCSESAQIVPLSRSRVRMWCGTPLRRSGRS